MKNRIRKGMVLTLAMFMAMSLSVGTAFADDDKKDKKDHDDVITIVGPAGPQGPIGLTGAAGTNGADGATGPIGLTGAAGTNGTNGTDGATGPVGLTGAAGTNGTNGTDGATGPIGLTGAAGADGATGATGAQGTVGLTGAAGADGATGATGAQGTVGLTGAAGADGATGAAGAQGLTGAAGADGATGATGATGAQGLAGSTGSTGPTGSAGADGAVGTVGEDPLARDAACTVFNSLVLQGSLPSATLPGYCTAWKIAFVTSTKHNANLGGLSGADAICQGLATAASLPGTYMAWVADNTGSPASRFTHSTGPYVLTNGVRVADNWNDLTDGTIQHAINVDAAKNTIDTTFLNGNLVWTNTTSSGALSTQGGDGSCAHWSGASSYGRVASAGGVDQAWTGYWQWSNFCNVPNRLYCVQQ